MECHRSTPGTDARPIWLGHRGRWFHAESFDVAGPFNELLAVKQCAQRTASYFDGRLISLAVLDRSRDLRGSFLIVLGVFAIDHFKTIQWRADVVRVQLPGEHAA